MNETHDPALRSWVDSANGHADFPIQNLPFAMFRRQGSGEPWRGGVAIGDHIVDLSKLAQHGNLTGPARDALVAAAQPRLNEFMALGAHAASSLRLALSRGLRHDAAHKAAWRSCLVPQADAEYRVPARIGDYTDFYTSMHHATNVGRLFRPDQPLLPNYKWLPIGYHGRASTIGISGQTFKRPKGQRMPPDGAAPQLAPSARLDWELEAGIFIGRGNEAGEPITMGDAEEHVFGMCLLNDWSARDIQSWEYQPLGPFLSKNFATTLSPWIVTMEALLPYRVEWSREEDDPQPLPYLDSAANRSAGGIDIALEVLLETDAMRERGAAPFVVTRTNFRHAYWTVAQMVAHHTVNGCSLHAGDLFGSGTQSGPTPAEAGSLVELTRGGKQPIELEGGELRTFLEDDDRVIFRGHCARPGFARIGFGEVSGTVAPTDWQRP
jgi:fumarylacetoacetase